MTGEARWEGGTRFSAASEPEERGVYAWWHWDGTTLQAGVDPLGYFSLFYYRKGDSVAVSPSLLQLVAQGADTTPDEQARAVFYRMGMLVNDDTPFLHIRVLPPCGKLTWSVNSFEVTGEPPIPPARAIRRSEAIEGIIAQTQASVRHILDAWQGDFALPLSGGRDSRHILLEMHRQQRLPRTCVTFHQSGHHPDTEALAARAIAKRAGVPHILLGHARCRPADIFRMLVLTSLCADEHAQMMPLHDYFADQPYAVLDGIAGDVLTIPHDSSEVYLKLIEQGSYAEVARLMMQGHGRAISRPGWAQGAGPLYAPGWDEACAEYVGMSIQRFASAADPYQAFWFWNRTRREISFVSTAVLASAQAVFCPFLDPAFVFFCLSLPYAVTRDMKLHDEALARAYPSFRDVPFQEAFPRQRAARDTLANRLRKARVGMRIVLALDPGHPLRELAAYLRGDTRLTRRQGEIFRLHALCLQHLDATKAQRILTLASDLANQHAASLASDVFEP